VRERHSPERQQKIGSLKSRSTVTVRASNEEAKLANAAFPASAQIGGEGGTVELPALFVEHDRQIAGPSLGEQALGLVALASRGIRGPALWNLNDAYRTPAERPACGFKPIAIALQQDALRTVLHSTYGGQNHAHGSKPPRPRAGQSARKRQADTLRI
jgi:hypothetical protein